MGKYRCIHRVNKVSPFSLLILLLIHFISSSSSSSYEVPNKYFINCGSDQTVNYTGRSFTGDENRNSLSVVHTDLNTSIAKANKPPNATSAIYSTARIFRQQSSYAFEASDSDSPSSSSYLVRLHFLAFGSAIDLSEAVFDVSTSSGDLLLHSFVGKDVAKTPSVKEFYVAKNSTAKRFRLYFTPRNSSLAFVNAIEFFPNIPLDFNVDDAIVVGAQRKFASRPVLQTIYRINVGGDKIEPGGDVIWRNWNSDEDFLETKNSNTGLNKPYDGELDYPSEEAKLAAPDLVYRTAKILSNGSSNITWNFVVNKTSSHHLRVHFCDFVSINSDVLHFNFYINDTLGAEISFSDLATPLYANFTVGSLGSGVLKISIGPANVNEEKNAILNGIEILEIKEGLASVPFEADIVGGGKTKLFVMLGSILGGVAILFVLAAVLFYYAVVRRRRKNPDASAGEWSSWGHVAAVFGGGHSHSYATSATINGSPVPNLNLGLRISLSEIQRATKQFNPKLVVGRGGFGSVYKGTLVGGTRVAVKRSAPGSGQGLHEFQTEIMVLSSIRHRHLVSLIGYCDEKNEMILVYEFMENGTLRDHLYESDLPRLSWRQRLEICIGSANGLNYLHKGSSTGGIIHRDVKSTNILLDENMVAKVADFGLSKAGPLGDTHVSTVVKGTLGYLDPEYYMNEQLTEKSDVYSFGVVLLEVLCARPAIDTTLPREQKNLAEWAMSCKARGGLAKIVDPSIRDEINPNSLRKFAETAEKCLNEDGLERPAMSDVIWDLEYALQLQRTPPAREPHEDSTVATASGFSAAIILPDSSRIPSHDYDVDNDDDDDDDHSDVVTKDFSAMSGSEMFSQLKQDGAR